MKAIDDKIMDIIIDSNICKSKAEVRRLQLMGAIKIEKDKINIGKTKVIFLDKVKQAQITAIESSDIIEIIDKYEIAIEYLQQQNTELIKMLNKLRFEYNWEIPSDYTKDSTVIELNKLLNKIQGGN